MDVPGSEGTIEKEMVRQQKALQILICYNDIFCIVLIGRAQLPLDQKLEDSMRIPSIPCEWDASTSWLSFILEVAAPSTCSVRHLVSQTLAAGLARHLVETEPVSSVPYSIITAKWRRRSILL
ncbi:MAG: hypothetical protein LQ341_000982 [Variospora aurantia]|nr:MAG: hypothetical protein LQ341_000982 [Variospora aurantia]